MSKILNKSDYKVLEKADLVFDGDIAGVLNKNGCSNWTICPECHLDDFTHVENCPLDDESSV
jgi:hypothetical protein